MVANTYNPRRCNPGDQIQSFMPMRITLYQPSYIPIPEVFSLQYDTHDIMYNCLGTI